MADFKCVFIIRAENKILFKANSAGKYELPSAQQDIHADRIKEYIQKTYQLEVVECQELPSPAAHPIHLYYACVSKPATNTPFGQKWFTLLTAANKLPTQEAYDAIRDFLRQQAVLSNIQLQFGLRGGKVVAIGELSPDERGLKCGCTCPVCGGDLQARIGAKKQPHFAHNKIVDCNIAFAQQTALHLLAKEIIADAKGMYLPAAVVNYKDVFPFEDNQTWEIKHRLPASILYRPAGFFPCSKVILEKRLSDIIPDIILEQGEQRILVEIAVTHFIDEEKKSKIETLGLPVLEVDLSDLRADELNREVISRRLLSEPEQKRWVFLPETEARQAAVAQYRSHYENTKEELKAEERQRAEKEKLQEKKRKIAQKKYQYLLRPDRYSNTLAQRRNDTQALRAIQKLGFSRNWNAEAIPFFFDIPTTGDLVFECDRRIWQAAIFGTFVFSRNMQKTDPIIISTKKIASWSTKHQDIFKIDWELMPEVLCSYSGHGYPRSLLEQSIREYLYYLARIGFIQERPDSKAQLLASHTILPPNREAARVLEEALNMIDLFLPDAPDRLRQYMDDFDRWEQEQKEKATQAKERAERMKERQSQREAGFQEICASLSEDGFEGDTPLKDSFGFRWLICTECGSIAREDEMATYGGRAGTNKGICRDCSRRK